MNRTIIFHIGHPKTGTTTLQRTLQASRTCLAKAGILHPDTGDHPNHKILIPHLFEAGQDDENKASAVWESVIGQVEAARPHTIIFSSEGFFRSRGEASMQALKANLHAISEDVKIAAYLREPASFTLSRAQQRVKRSPSIALIADDYYRAAIEPYMASNIGSLNVRLFDRNMLKDSDIVADFFDQNLPGFDTSALVRAKDSNISLSAEAMSLLQDIAMGIRKIPLGNARKIIGDTDQHLDGYARPKMHAHVTQAIRSRATDLDWLSDNFDLRFPGIDPGAMAKTEAVRICENLTLVEDLCIVDTERKDALWRASNRPEHSVRAFFERFK
ncbi:MAG: hypothetical protein ACU0CA_13425 [Paracoccaceae bacterium]